MLIASMKSVIKYAIELDIDYLEIFLGYEGVKVLHITIGDKNVVTLVETYAKNLGLDCNYEYKMEGKHGPAYSIYIGVEDSSIYKFKNEKKEHDREFKAALVLEVLKNKRTLAEIANEHNISPKILREWKETFLGNVETPMNSKDSNKS